MNHGSLFSGIGGFDLAAEWMGWSNKFHCEWNLFGQKVLKHYWPEAESYTDITTTDFNLWRGKIDILTGGFPCQPYSQAGKRLGKEDDRHLWPEMLRTIREIQPKYVVGENVSGLINWNGGMVFDEVQAELEAEGYEVRPFILPACAVNAPHRRDRVWFVAYRSTGIKGNEIGERNGQKAFDGVAGYGCKGYATNTNNERLERGKEIGNAGFSRTESNQQSERLFNSRAWRDFPTQSPVCSRNDGLSSRLDGITFPKWRNESIKAGGNAIVPRVALQIFKAIEQFNKIENGH